LTQTIGDGLSGAYISGITYMSGKIVQNAAQNRCAENGSGIPESAKNYDNTGLENEPKQRVPLPGNADFVGPINEGGGWRLVPDGEGAHLIEKANVNGRSNLMKYNVKETPRYYPYGTAESAGQAHVRLHEATRNQGIKLRGGNPNMTDSELINRYGEAHNEESLSGIRGELSYIHRIL